MQFLYLIECKDHYKIGVANDVKSRLAQLATGNPFPLTVMACFGFENAEIVEKVLHQKFSMYRTIGEWFLLSDKNVSAFLNICRELGGAESFFSNATPQNEEVQEAEEDQEAFNESDLRIEKRYNPVTGEVRGFAFRERNNQRRVVKYVGIRDKEAFAELMESEILNGKGGE